MRCVLSKGKQKELLISTKVALGLSWRGLAQKIGISYTTIREWRDEKWSIRQDIFDRIIVVCPEQKSFKQYIIELKRGHMGPKGRWLKHKTTYAWFLRSSVYATKQFLEI